MNEVKNTSRGWISKKRSLFFILVFLIATFGAVFYGFIIGNDWLSKDFEKQKNMVDSKQKFEDLYLFIQKTESGVRGYASTGNDKYVKNLSPHLDSLRINYLELKNFLQNENIVTNKQVYVELERLIQEKIVFMEKTKKLCDDNDCEGALALIATERGIKLTDSIVIIYENINSSIVRTLHDSKQQFKKIEGRNNRLAYGGMIAALLVIVIAFFLLRKEIERTKNINTQLQLQKDYFRITLNSIGDGLIATDKKGNILFMNPSAENLTGWENHEVKNEPLKKVYNVFNEDTGQPFNNIANRILTEGKAIAFENNTILKTRNDDELIIKNTGSPLIDDKGNISGTVLVFSDITEQKKNEEKIINSEKRYRNLFNQASDAIVVYSMDGKIHEFNKILCDLSGYTEEEFSTINISDIIVGKLIEDEEKFALLKKGESITQNRQFKRKDGLVVDMEIKAKAIGEEKILAFARDITERTKAERELKRLKENYLALINSVDGIVWEADADTFKFTFVSDKAERLLGFPKEIWVEQASFWVDHIYSEDKEWAVDYCKKSTKEKINHDFEYRMVAADGRIIWLRDIVTVHVENDQPVKLIGIMVDITNQKLSEKESEEKNKQLQLLAEHLQNVREEERASMAREIHDELGQQLTIMKMDIAWLQENFNKEDAALMHRSEELKNMLDLTINTVRRIAYELRPSVLDDMGLVAAIEWQVSEFEKRSGINTTYEGYKDKLPLTNTAETGLFRIVQESLTNVGRYAKAKNIRVSLSIIDDKVILGIIDDGIGFELDKLAFKKTLGIVGMKERCIMLGGEFKIDSTVGNGTKIKVTVPVQNNTG